MSYRPGKLRLLFFVLVMLALISVPMIWFVGGPYTEAFPRTFDTQRWHAAAEPWGPDNPHTKVRCGMILDLEYRIGIVGKSKAEVISLLGRPDYSFDQGSASHDRWALCPSFMDLWVPEIRWQDDRAVSAVVRDT